MMTATTAVMTTTTAAVPTVTTATAAIAAATLVATTAGVPLATVTLRRSERRTDLPEYLVHRICRALHARNAGQRKQRHE